MAQRKLIKPRTCTNCQKSIDTDAKGIQAHAAECAATLAQADEAKG